MEVVFLGTSAAEGFPAPFCSCDTCRRARENGGKDLRLRSSVLVDGVVKIDQSPDTAAQAQRLGMCFDSVRVLLVTHTHEDHLYPDDVLLLVPPFSATFEGPLAVRGPGGVAECVFRSAVHVWAREALDIAPLRAFRTEALPGGYEVTPLPAAHVPERVCFNYLLKAPGGETLLYATDTGPWPEETFDFLRSSGMRADAVIMEATNGALEENGVHLSAAGTVEMRRRLVEQGSVSPDGPFYATHFSHAGRLLHSGLEEVFAPHGITPAWDGLKFSFSA